MIVTNIAITAPNPALMPDKFKINKNTSSTVAGMVNSAVETFTGSANFRTLAIAVITQFLSPQQKLVNNILQQVPVCSKFLHKVIEN